MTHLLLAVVVFAAVMTQSLAGFGLALVAMALLAGLLGLHVAAPLVALVALVAEVALLLRYRAALQLRAVWRLVLASTLATPLGLLALAHLDERVALGALGLLVSGYALYALFSPRLPELRHPAWAYSLGFLAGLLGGAYNTPGPPVVVYGTCRRWQPDQFRGNLQGFFLVNSLLVVVGHAWSGHFTPAVWQGCLVALPAIGLGLWAGRRLDGRLSPSLFRKLVLGLLLVVGLRLMLTAWS